MPQKQLFGCIIFVLRHSSETYCSCFREVNQVRPYDWHLSTKALGAWYKATPIVETTSLLAQASNMDARTQHDMAVYRARPIDAKSG